MTPPHELLDDTARAVLDGTPVDWAALGRQSDPDTRALIAQLQVLDTLGDVHRGDTKPEQPAWGHLRLLERVGTGSSGEVFRAWDTHLAREVALKLTRASVTPDGASPIIEEGRLLARVRHPNVATIYGAEARDGSVGLWMEFIPGRTLEQLLRSGHQFSPADAIAIGLGLSAAVSAVHAAGVLHRDIKTQNVMRTDDGRVVLTDFGAGRELDDVTDAAGTPLFAAPEVLSGGPATTRADVYSVGVVLFRVLTGRYPVEADTLDALRAAHARGDVADLATVRPDLPPSLVQIVRRATCPNPDERYATSDALAADLRRLQTRPGRSWIAAAGAAAVLGAVLWLAWPGSSGDDNTARWSAARVGSWFGLSRPASTSAPVIVVKPFRNLRTDADSDLLVDGLTYELIRHLSVVDGLLVRSASSSFSLKDRELALADIGSEFGATLVLEGSVSGTGDQLRVQAQLARVTGDSPLWTRKIDRLLTDVLAVEDEIARAVVNELRLTLGAAQRRYTLDPQLQTLYLRARALTGRRGSENAEAAVGLYEQVIAGDPDFTPAYAGLCEAYGYWSQDLPDVLGLPHQEAVGAMRAAALRAMELDPLLAESHAAMGFLAAREHDWAAAQRSFARAIELNPSLLDVYTGYSLTTLLPLGRLEESEALLLDALRRDPRSLDVLRELGFVYLTNGRYDDAIDLFDRVIAIDPAFTYVPMLRARAQSLAGRFDEAMPYWESVRSQPGSQHWLAYAFVQAGRRDEIERLAARPNVPALRRVLFFAALGDADRALSALEEAADSVPHRTVRLLQYPELDALTADPRFEAIRRRFGLP